MLKTIEKGIKIKCLACGKSFEVMDNTVINAWDGKYVTCPICKRSLCMENYLAHGEYSN